MDLTKDGLKLSVVMPVYNAGKYVASAIESVLAQTYKNFEFIIVNDASTDDSEKIILSFAANDKRIVYLTNEKNRQICETLNIGINAAKGEYIARMDADDWSFPDRFAKQIAFLAKNPEVVLLGGAIEVADEKMLVKNIRNYPLTDKNIRHTILKYSAFAHPAVIFKRETAIKCGLYSPLLIDSEDYDFFLRLGHYGKLANLEDILLRLRTHGKSVSQTRIKRQSILTIYIKFKAVVEYHYELSFSDKLFMVAHMFGSVLIPPKLRFGIFNLIRKN